MKLFNYRREKLRASILLDGYHLLSRASAGAESQPRGNDIFQDKLAAASLQALVDLQREFKVSDEEELVTLHSYAGLLRTMNDRRAYAIQDQAMGVAWRMRDKALEEQFVELMFDCQIGWIETRVKNGRPVMAESEQDEAASAALPDIDAAIDFIKKHQSLKNYPGLLARFQRAELFHNLSLANLDVSRDLIAELKAPGSPWDDDALLIPSLKMLLAIQTGDFATAFEIKKTSLMDVLSQPQGQKHMIPLYALAELENATHFSTIDAILELHNLLQAPLAANSPEPSPLLHTLRRENALQLAWRCPTRKSFELTSRPIGRNSRPQFSAWFRLFRSTEIRRRIYECSDILLKRTPRIRILRCTVLVPESHWLGMYCNDSRISGRKRRKRFKLLGKPMSARSKTLSSRVTMRLPTCVGK